MPSSTVLTARVLFMLTCVCRLPGTNAKINVFEDSISCPKGPVSLGSMLMCSVLKMPDQLIELTLQNKHTTLALCSIQPKQLLRIPARIAMHYEDPSDEITLYAKQGDKPIGSITFETVNRRKKQKFEKQRGLYTFAIETEEDVTVSWEFYRYIFEIANNENCYFKQFEGKIDVSSFVNEFAPMPVETLTWGKTVLIPWLPFGTVFARAVSDKGTDREEHMIKQNIKAEKDFLIHYEPDPSPGTFPWPKTDDFKVNLTKCYSPHLTPHSGFDGDPSEFLWITINSLTNKIQAKDLGGQVFVIKKDSLSHQVENEIRFQVTFGFSSKDEMKMMRNDQDETFSREFKMVVTGQVWPALRLRCFHNCIQNSWYFFNKREYMLHCPRCLAENIEIHVFSPCLGSKTCGNQHPEFVSVASHKNQPVNVMNNKFHDMRKFVINKALYHSVKLNTLRLDMTPTCRIRGKVYDCGFKEKEKQNNLDIETPTTVLHFVCQWNFGDELVSLPWLSTMQWEFSHMAITLIRNNALLLPMPIMNISKISGNKVKDISLVTFDLSDKTVKGFRKVRSTEVLSDVFSDLYKGPFETGIYGVRLYWLMVRALKIHNSTDNNAQLRKELYSRYIPILATSHLVKYSEIEIILDTLKISLMDREVEFQKEMLHGVPAVLDKVLHTLTSVVKDVPVKIIPKQCALLDTLMGAWKRFTTHELFYTGQPFYNRLGSKILAVARHMARTMGKLDEICQGTDWNLQVKKMYVEQRSSYSQSVLYVMPFEDIEYRFNRQAMYEKTEEHRDDFIDLDIFILVLHMSTSVLFKGWVSNWEATTGTVIIEQLRRFDTKVLNRRRADNSLTIVYRKESQRDVRSLKMRKEEDADSNHLKFKYMIKDGELLSDCSWLLIKTNNSVYRSLVIEFEHIEGVEMTFLFRSALAKKGRDVVDFNEIADTNYLTGTKVRINIPPVTKKYIYDYPDSNHIYLLKLDRITGRPDGLYHSVLRVHLTSVYCSYISEPATNWELGICKPTSIEIESIMCTCTRMAGMFSLDIVDSSDQLKKWLIHSKLIKVLNPNNRPWQLMVVFMIAVLWIFFFAFLILVKKQDYADRNLYRTHLVRYHFNPEDRYRYLICVNTSALPQSGMMSKAWFVLVGNLRSSGEMLLDNGHNFVSGSETWFMASTSLILGSIQAVTVRMDSGKLVDSWRIKCLDVYDVTKDTLTRAYSVHQFSNTRAWQMLISTSLSGPVMYNQRFIQNFTNLMLYHHVILSSLLTTPGAEPRIRSLIRLLCLVLWCFVVTIIFVIGVPKYQFDDEKLEAAYIHVLYFTPLLAVVDKFIHVVLSKLLPSGEWRLRLRKFHVPQPRLVCPETKYDENLIGIAFNRPPVMPYSFHGVIDSFSGQLMKTDGRIPKKQVSNIIAYYLQRGSLETAVDARRRTDLRLHRQFNYVQTLARVNQEVMETRRQHGSLGERIRFGIQGKSGSFFTPIPLTSIIAQDIFQRDPVVSRITVIGKNVYSPTTMNSLRPKHAAYTSVESTEGEWYHFIRSAVSFSIALSILLVTAFICKLSVHQREDENLYTVIFSMLMLIIAIFVVEPLSYLVFALVLSTIYMGDSTMFWARRRTAEVDTVLKRLYRVQEANYMSKNRYFSSWEYKGLGNNWFRRMENLLQRIKMVDVELGNVQGNRIRLLLLILCALTIINVHSDVHGSYLLKKSIFNDLNINDTLEYTAGQVDELWKFLAEDHVPFIKAENKVLKKFSRIRQVRTGPVEDCRGIPFSKQKQDKRHCLVTINHDTEETRDFCKDWNKTMESTLASQRQKCFGFFQYTKPTVDSLLEYALTDYPLGGYQYVMKGTKSEDRLTIEQMEASKWVDDRTRAVLVESTVFNINTGNAAVVTTVYRFQLNGIRVTHRCDSFAFIFEENSFYVLVSALGIWAILTLAEASTQLSKLTTLGIKSYFHNTDNIINLINLIFYFLLLLGFGFRQHLSSIKYHLLNKAVFGTDEPLYISLRDISLVVMSLNGVSGFLALAALLILFQNARHLHRFHIMAIMIKHVFTLAIVPVMCTCCLSFIIFIHFHTQSYEVSTFLNAVYSVIEFIIRQNHIDVGKSDLQEPLTVALWFIFFILITNGFLVSLNEDYSVLVMAERAKSARNKRYLLASYERVKTREDDIEDERNRADQKLLSTSIN